MDYYIYILTNKPRGTLYVGMTTDLSKRVFQHRNNQYFGFSKKYNLKRLVYVEKVMDFETTRKRESQLKNWRRDWKIELIENVNPKWEDMSDMCY